MDKQSVDKPITDTTPPQKNNYVFGLVAITIFMLIYVLSIYVFMWSWNNTLPSLFGIHTITLFQSFWMIILISFINPSCATGTFGMCKNYVEQK